MTGLTPTPAATAETPPDLTDAIARTSAPFRDLIAEVGKVVVGQTGLIERMVIALLGNGHLLIEGVPGLAKTSAVSSLARAMDTGFQRLQFTPDLLPADIIGTQVYRPQTHEFVVQRGPIFSNLILADEINRAPAKVQAALLEAMQERQVSIAGETFPLDDPFIVMATQNPIEQEGTYPLPEAQMDRFMMKVHVDYPDRDEELAILDRMSGIGTRIELRPVVTPEDIRAARTLIDAIACQDALRGYIVDLVMATRAKAGSGVNRDGWIEAGASPRATVALTVAARVKAYLAGRDYAVPQDVKDVALDVLRHRVVLGFEAEAEDVTADDVVRRVLSEVPAP